MADESRYAWLYRVRATSSLKGRLSIPMRRLGGAIALGASLMGASCTCCISKHPQMMSQERDPAERLPVVVEVPGSTLSFTMVPVSLAGGGRLWISTTEVTWDAYDLFVYGEDDGDGNHASDALTQPTKPYIAMDRGFGRTGHPAISMSFLGASTFCEWLSSRTGRTFRLPTVDEWRDICAQGGAQGEFDDRAWHSANSDGRTHPVATKLPCRLGLFDMLGNAAEWAIDGDGNGVVLGGSYRDDAERLTCDLMALPTPEWNASDPQFPQSRWWLADAPFVGFRIVMVE